MSIAKRKGSPHYWYDFTVGGMRVRGSTETNDAGAARTIEAALRKEAALGAHLKRKPRITLDHAYARYWKEHGQFLRAQEVTRINARQALVYFGKGLYLDELDDARISAFVAHLRATPIGQKKKRPITPGAINRKLDDLAALIGRAGKWGVELPAVKVSSHKLRAAEARTRWITPEEADRLICHAPEHSRAIIRTALLTGLRLGNILGLTWSQVNLPARTIRVRVKSKLPGGKKLEVPISDKLAALLRWQLRWQIRELGTVPQAGHVFLRRYKNSLINGKRRPRALAPAPLDAVKKGFNTAANKAGLEDFRFHDLRHTAASWMIQRGVPLDVVQQILGHAHISQTQKYAHRQATDRLAAMNALAATPQNHFRDPAKMVKPTKRKAA